MTAQPASTTDTTAPARSVVTAIADALKHPPNLTGHGSRRRAALWVGAAGTALLHVERARAGDGDWDTADRWIRAMTTTPLDAGPDAGLHAGVVPAAFVLHCAGQERYQGALAHLDAYVDELAHRRVDLAAAKGSVQRFATYDLLHGLTGIGTYLFRSAPGGNALSRILGYLVQLGLGVSGRPGWWVDHGPDLSQPLPGGHANLGLAHGITGVLALLSHTFRTGIVVDGHLDAIVEITGWLHRWVAPDGLWWPQWITSRDLVPGHAAQHRPGRASWCYGTPGIARALQAAGIALDDTAGRRLAEKALLTCLLDPRQSGQLTDAGLCHGYAGLYQTVFRAAGDALTPELTHHLPHLADLTITAARRHPGTGLGLLEGPAGTALALHTAGRGTAPATAWDTCLLLA